MPRIHSANSHREHGRASWLTPLSPAESAVTIDRFRAGDDSVFAEFVAHFNPVLRREAQRVIHAPDDVDDVVQETWIRAYERRAQFGAYGSLEGWLRSMCRHASIDWLRAQVRRDESTLDMDVIETPHSRWPGWHNTVELGLRAQEMHDLVDDQIMSLPGLQRNVAALRWLLGWSTRRIAAYLTVAPGTVKVELFRAREKLRHRPIDERIMDRKEATWARFISGHEALSC